MSKKKLSVCPDPASVISSIVNSFRLHYIHVLQTTVNSRLYPQMCISKKVFDNFS